MICAETTVDLDKKTPTNTSIISRSFDTIIVEENTNISDKNTSIDANYLKKNYRYYQSNWG